MCAGCWEEAGRPVADRMETNRLALQVNWVDAYGPLHHIVEDWNVEDEHLVNNSDHPLTDFEQEIVEGMRKLPLAQRYAALALANGLYGVKSIR